MKYSFFSYVKLYKKEFILGPLFKLIETCFELTIPFILARIIVSEDRDYILRMTGVLGAFIILGIIFASLCQYYAAIAAVGVTAKIREDAYERVSKFTFSDLDGFSSAGIVNRLTNDARVLERAILLFIRIAVRAPFWIVGCVVMCLLLNVEATIAVILCIPPIALAFVFVTRALWKRFKGIQDSLDNVYLVAKENVAGARSVRAFSREGDERAKFEKAAENYRKKSTAALMISSFSGPFNSLVIGVGIAVVVYLFAASQSIGEIAQISAFVTYMLQISIAITLISMLTTLFVRAAACNKRIGELFIDNEKR
jgi:ATP-binding cassette subfamily B protein